MARKRTEIWVKAVWDEEARVYYVDDSNVPGLVAEADTAEQLTEILRRRIPEMIEANSTPVATAKIPARISWEKHHMLNMAFSC